MLVIGKGKSSSAWVGKSGREKDGTDLK